MRSVTCAPRRLSSSGPGADAFDLAHLGELLDGITMDKVREGSNLYGDVLQFVLAAQEIAKQVKALQTKPAAADDAQ